MRHFRQYVRDFFFLSPWGSKSFAFLLISVISGCVVALQFNLSEPFYSAAALDLIVPFGWFWRSIHFYSSQLFFVLSCVHMAVIVANGSLLRMPFRQWFKLILSLLVILLLLFTGYVLRADTTGEAAGFIAESIALSIPLFGDLVNAVLFAIAKVGLGRIYANHVIGLAFLWLVLSWDHIRRYRLDFVQQGKDILLFLLFCVFVPAPLEQVGLNPQSIKGPWFFLGVQELLRTVQPFWAGVIFPTLLPLAILLIYPPAFKRKAVVFSLLWLLVYSALSLVAAVRA